MAGIISLTGASIIWLESWAGETIDLRFRFRTGFEGSISDENETLWTGNDGFGVDNLTITKQTQHSSLMCKTNKLKLT